MANRPRAATPPRPPRPPVGGSHVPAAASDDPLGNLGPDPLGEAPANDPLVQVEAEEDARMVEILRDEGTGSVLEINRKDPLNQRWCWLLNIPVAEWDSGKHKDEIGRRFGGGEYKAKVRKKGGLPGSSFFFDLDRTIKPEPVEGGNPKLDDKFDRLSRQIQEMQVKQAGGGGGGSNETLAMMMQMMQMQNQTLIALITKPQAAVPPPSENLMLMLANKAMTPAAGLDLEKITSVIVNLSKAMQGRGPDRDEEEGGGMLGGIMKHLPTIIMGLANLSKPAPVETPAPLAAPATPAAAAPAAAPGPVATPAAATAANAPSTPANPIIDVGGTGRTEGETDAGTKSALAAFLPTLMTQAEMGTDPALVAQHLSANLPADQFDSIVDLLEREDWLAVLADAHEPVMQMTPWFGNLRAEIFKIMYPDNAAQNGAA